MEVINKIKNFDFNKFNWKEAVAGPDGKSSAGKMLCWLYGLSLILLTCIAGILYLLRWVDQSGINNIFIFVGLQMPIVLGYLLSNKNLEIKSN